MINYFKMKKNEWKIKAQFYGMISHLIDDQKDVIETLEKLFDSLKDTPAFNNMQTELSSE